MARVQQNLEPGETVLAEAGDGTKLVVYRPIEDVRIEESDEGGRLVIDLDELDHAEAAVRFTWDDPKDGEIVEDMEFSKLLDARLAFGLWVRCGPFVQPESGRSIPVEVAVDGQDAVTAWVHLNNGAVLSRAGTASVVGVTEQTVSDRLSRVRWRPPERGE